MAYAKQNLQSKAFTKCAFEHNSESLQRLITVTNVQDLGCFSPAQKIFTNTLPKRSAY